MATLHIEHAITDLSTWLAAFERFEDARTAAGVRRYRIHQPVEDPHYIYIQLDFDDPSAASDFLEFLRRVVWSNPEASPGLSGHPVGRLLDEVRLST